MPRLLLTDSRVKLIGPAPLRIFRVLDVCEVEQLHPVFRWSQIHASGHGGGSVFRGKDLFSQTFGEGIERLSICERFWFSEQIKDLYIREIEV